MLIRYIPIVNKRSLSRKFVVQKVPTNKGYQLIDLGAKLGATESEGQMNGPPVKAKKVLT
jgi:hypothetical protein